MTVAMSFPARFTPTCAVYTAPLRSCSRQQSILVTALHVHTSHRQVLRKSSVWCTASSADAAQKYGWKLDGKPNPHKTGDLIELPVSAIRRPLGKTRSNDQDKIQALMDSIGEMGLKEPIDILEVDGKYYGFSGCHRYEAFQRLGIEKIPCKVRKANQNTLKMHMI